MSQFDLRAGGRSDVLTTETLEFVALLERTFRPQRAALILARQERQRALDNGAPFVLLDSAPDDWTIDPVPADLVERKVEITGPVDQKMMINALNSGASVFMADFEDATSPTWLNLIDGQANVLAAYRRELSLDTNEKSYRLNDEVATLMVRPRGWHLPEKHLVVDGRPVSASLFDFGLYLFHGGRAALEAGSGPYLYLPKLESHLEARLWNDVFAYAQDQLGIPTGTIKATVLVETLPAAFEMDAILYELRSHSAGLNAGRWDYIFSTIKKLRAREDFVLPDRSAVTMTVPFMRAYTKLQVQTCHRRRAHAIGGMAAFIPNRRDAEVTERALAKVTEDKEREARLGCDGTWVAHPDLVPVARQVFDSVLGERPNQLNVIPEGEVTAADLLDFPAGMITDAGLRQNVRVGLLYLSSWLAGSGAVGIDNLMEDVATAEISRSQIWQWVQREARTDEGEIIDRALVEKVAGEIMAESTTDLSDAWEVFSEVSLGDDFVEFLTLSAYDRLD
ncbi:MAG: malate synthase A [Acidimicrobiia bacterium]|nr:malate synthase A [Acidimicrobiia bacterium]